MQHHQETATYEPGNLTTDNPIAGKARCGGGDMRESVDSRLLGDRSSGETMSSGARWSFPIEASTWGIPDGYLIIV